MSRECFELELDEETICALESLCGGEPLCECVTEILKRAASDRTVLYLLLNYNKIRQAVQTLAAAVAQEIMKQIGGAHAVQK